MSAGGRVEAVVEEVVLLEQTRDKARSIRSVFPGVRMALRRRSSSKLGETTLDSPFDCAAAAAAK